MPNPAWRLLVISCLSLLLAGCFSFGLGDRDDAEPQYYLLNADRGRSVTPQPAAPSITIVTVEVVSRYRDINLVYRVDDERYESVPGHEFIDQPARMFTAELKRWLEKSGLFSTVKVAESGENAETDYVLQTAVSAFFGERRRQYSPLAVLEMQFFLSKPGTEEPVFETGYLIEADIPEASPQQTVKGWNMALTETLGRLELDMGDFFFE